MKRPIPLSRLIFFLFACAFLGAAIALKNPPSGPDRSPASPSSPSAPAAVLPPPHPSQGPTTATTLPFRALEVLESKETIESGQRVKRSVIRTTEKYPFILVIERWKNEGSDAQREMVAADHVLIRIKDGSSASDLVRAVEAMGCRLKRIGVSPYYVVNLPGHSIGEVDDAISRLMGRSDVVVSATADHVVTAI